MRAARPLLLRGVLRFDTLRSLSRVGILAALDIASLFAAIWTALAIKAAVQDPEVLGGTYHQAKEYAPLACLVMVLLFARSGLYRDRAQRPGFAKVIRSLFEVVLVILIYAEIEGQAFKSYYIFYGTLFFALVYVSSTRWVFERVSGFVLRAAGYRRRAVLVGSGAEHRGGVRRAPREQDDRALRLRGPHAVAEAERTARLPRRSTSSSGTSTRSTRC